MSSIAYKCFTTCIHFVLTIYLKHRRFLGTEKFAFAFFLHHKHLLFDHMNISAKLIWSSFLDSKFQVSCIYLNSIFVFQLGAHIPFFLIYSFLIDTPNCHNIRIIFSSEHVYLFFLSFSPVITIFFQCLPNISLSSAVNL